LIKASIAVHTNYETRTPMGWYVQPIGQVRVDAA